jgi:hypothetical protein
MGERLSIILPKNGEFYAISRVFFYMPQIYDMGPTSFTSPPKEGMVRKFSP